MMGWLFLRTLRLVMSASLGQRSDDPQINANAKGSEKPGATLDLSACPYCGVYTAVPCTNPACPSR